MLFLALIVSFLILLENEESLINRVNFSFIKFDSEEKFELKSKNNEFKNEFKSCQSFNEIPL